jgi:hypothetical protein
LYDLYKNFLNILDTINTIVLWSKSFSRPCNSIHVLLHFCGSNAKQSRLKP